MHTIGSNISWEDLYIELPESATTPLLQEWRWKIGEGYSIYLISALGDLFLEDRKGRIHWLDTGRGNFTQIARSTGEMATFLMDFEKVHEWFVHDLIREFHRMGSVNHSEEVYGCVIPPIVGGTYDPENFETIDAVDHIQRMGRIHHKVADLPEGADIDPAILE